VNVMNHQQAAQEAAQEAERLATNRKELVERIGRALPEDGIAQPLPGVNLCRFSSPLGPHYVGVTPCVCVIAQGSKQVLLGNKLYRYDPLHYLLTTIGLPSVPQVIEASKEQPHLSLSLYLAPTLVNSVLLEIGHAQPPEPADVRAIAVSPVDGHLLEACVRLMRLLETPADAPILQPLIMREMVYRLLKGEQGARLSQLAIPGSYTTSIARAVERLRQNFNQPLRIEELSRETGHERLRVTQALQGRHGDESLAIPETVAAAGSPPSVAGRKPGCSQYGLASGLPGRLAFQSGVQKSLRRHPHTRCATPAGRDAVFSFPMSKMGTVLQADER
jgi:hypothetical protein